MTAIPPHRRRTVAKTRVRRKRFERAEWLRENRAALKAYNEHVEKHGVYSDGLRSF